MSYVLESWIFTRNGNIHEANLYEPGRMTRSSLCCVCPTDLRLHRKPGHQQAQLSHHLPAPRQLNGQNLWPQAGLVLHFCYEVKDKRPDCQSHSDLQGSHWPRRAAQTCPSPGVFCAVSSCLCANVLTLVSDWKILEFSWTLLKLHLWNFTYSQGLMASWHDPRSFCM